MKSRATPQFWRCFNRLPPKVQEIARKNYLLWRENPGLGSLAFKRIRDDLWSVRAGSGFRALATVVEGVHVWFWIGAHDEYERLIRGH